MTDENVKICEFSRRQLLSRFDVVHVHWPEFLIRGAPRRIALFDAAKVLGLLALARRRGAVLIWTGHNLEPHSGSTPVSRFFLERFVSMVDLLISLGGPATVAIHDKHPRLRGIPAVQIPHGHYRDFYPSPPARHKARHLLGMPQDAVIFLTLGQIRQYKNTTAYLEEARASLQPSEMVALAGEPRDYGLAEELVAAAAGDPRIFLDLKRVSDEELSLLHAACDVVVLPYSQGGSALHSGAAILALSFNRPVVVADTPTMEDLSRGVGAAWVGVHNGGISSILSTARSLAHSPRAPVAPLDDLEWPAIAAKTVQAYRLAMSRRSRRCATD